MPSKLPRYTICLDGADRHILEVLSERSGVPASVIVRMCLRTRWINESGQSTLCADGTACRRSAEEQKERRAAAVRRWKAAGAAGGEKA